MISIQTYIMRSSKDPVRKKHLIMSPMILNQHAADFFIEFRQTEKLVAYINEWNRSKPKFLNSVMTIDFNGEKIVDYVFYDLNIWFTYLGALKDFITNGHADVSYGTEALYRLELSGSNKNLYFVIKDDMNKTKFVEATLPKKEFLITLIEEIEYVITTIRKYQLYHESSKIFTIEILLEDIDYLKRKIHRMRDGKRD